MLGVLAAAILFAQMRLVRQHWDIILESVRPPVDPLLRQGQFRRAVGGFLLGFGALVFGAAGLARHFADRARVLVRHRELTPALSGAV